MMIGSNKPSKLMILMDQEACEYYGTSFNHVTAPGKDQCLQMDLLNMPGGFDLAGVCLSHDCWRQGKAQELIQTPKPRQRQHAASALRDQ